MIKELTCIGCPLGCHISANINGKQIENIEGYSCNIGKKYAVEELTLPRRMVTSLMEVYGSDEPLSVKTDKAIDKTKIFECLNEIKSKKAVLPINIGDILIKNVCNTDVNIVATKKLY